MSRHALIQRKMPDGDLKGVYLLSADGADLTSYHTDTDSYWEWKGRQALESRGPACDWPEWFTQLSERTPYEVQYVPLSVQDSTTARALYVAVAKADEAA